MRLLHPLCALTLLIAATAPPMEAPATDWPLERIVSNLEQQLAGAPDDAQLHYNLGRAHAFAFALERSSLWASDTRVGPWIKDLPEQSRRLARKEQEAARDQLNNARPGDDELLAHLSQGVFHLERAVHIAGQFSRYPESEAQYELCLAWLLDTGAHLAPRVDAPEPFALARVELSPDDVERIEAILSDFWQSPNRQRIRRDISPELLTKIAAYCFRHRISSSEDRQAVIDAALVHYWREQAIEHYRHVVERSVAGMTKTRNDNLMVIVREARDSLMRLVEARGYRDTAEESALAELNTRVADVEKLESSSRWVTPLLLSLDGCSALPDLLAPALTVPFDLDGDAVVEPWPWVAPSTGFLVWDPEQGGEITSGQQLFGSASGWLFFPDGYRVLDALDDDRDGRLTGAELAGIAVWFDRDTDGVSDRGEVLPVEDLGIVALVTEPTERIGASLGNPCGLELADGRVLPTYDWVVERVEP